MAPLCFHNMISPSLGQTVPEGEDTQGGMERRGDGRAGGRAGSGTGVWAAAGEHHRGNIGGHVKRAK